MSEEIGDKESRKPRDVKEVKQNYQTGYLHGYVGDEAIQKSRDAGCHLCIATWDHGHKVTTYHPRTTGISWLGTMPS